MPTISEVIKDDYARIKDAYRRIVNLSHEDGETNNFIWSLACYLLAEELLVTPTIKERVVKGSKTEERFCRDFMSIIEKLQRLQAFDQIDEESFMASLSAIWVDLEPHMEEVSTCLLKLEKTFTKSDSEALAAKYLEVQRQMGIRYADNGATSRQSITTILETPLDNHRTELLAKPV
ncbi:hypothetical protein QBC46DRAFT_298213 [Diplogelasinospora grovesii]|uniref:Uncharacterized protein n=1 Tax=Diplogelasinospora grovesii TaxID=303347 RepID=A0AAN6MZF8_9PEZI|nr:hypothetical protein QBC46DRAFT_298213 [Diplogelasinospora grovesii]